ncbi:hypothetical protein BS50DRAFT_415637 [Corynespora cassiicola Philippines]|uniref:Uncharacterized protein n=1 Tax=Corynespora cassiicola Philippines TaxID=1448308 RepID=A0A2T2NM88_CORCC|nr:hypothetical protein BS50DRAFT_415637 [Corynespora cassiicola Philippines]
MVQSGAERPWRRGRVGRRGCWGFLVCSSRPGTYSSRSRTAQAYISSASLAASTSAASCRRAPARHSVGPSRPRLDGALPTGCVDQRFVSLFLLSSGTVRPADMVLRAPV